jgi:hypothetical protein
MSKIDTSVVWGPQVLGRGRLDERRWAYLVEAPFDMPSDIPDLIGMKVRLDGSEFEIRGVLPKLPLVPVVKGEPIELLVRSIGQP